MNAYCFLQEYFPASDTSACTDMHVHTTASDGTYSPAEVVRLAHQKGLTSLAITDHDTVQGIEEAISEGKRCGVEVIPGVELSIDRTEKKDEVHLLGYYIDTSNPALQYMLKRHLQSRLNRNPKIIDLLRAEGIDITYNEVEEEAGSSVVGRPHIARVLVRKGYVSTVAEAFEKYLGRGKKAYVPREKFELRSAAGAIIAAGGVPVLAHPYSIRGGMLENEEDKRIFNREVQEACLAGIKGIEVLYPEHNPIQMEHFFKVARELKLLITGGSDFHGLNKPHIHLGTINEEIRSIPHQLVLQIKKASSSITR
ncbi:MAG: PHP domain-containing protein [Thermoplasmata archaeon]